MKSAPWVRALPYVMYGCYRCVNHLRLKQSHDSDDCSAAHVVTPNPPTNIVDVRGFDSSIILISRGGILMFIGNLPESLSQAMLVGTMLVGRLGVWFDVSIDNLNCRLLKGLLDNPMNTSRLSRRTLSAVHGTTQ